MSKKRETEPVPDTGKSDAHTPGPWSYRKGGAFNPERWGIVERQNPDDDEDGETICEICDGDAAPADAALMASCA